MRSLIPRSTPAIVVAIAAVLLAAAAPAVSLKLITGRQIKDRSITGRDLKPGSISLSDLSPAARKALAGRVGPRGSTGAAGPQGAPGAGGAPGAAGPAGPSFGDTVQVQNVDNVPCFKNVVVGTEPVVVTRPSRIWAQSHATLVDNGTANDAYEFSMWVELRDAAGTTLANTVAAVTADKDRTSRNMPLSVDGTLLAGGMPGGDLAGTRAYVAAPGSYVLTLVTRAGAGTTCPAGGEDFGYNQQSSLGHILLGTSP